METGEKSDEKRVFLKKNLKSKKRSRCAQAAPHSLALTPNLSDQFLVKGIFSVPANCILKLHAMLSVNYLLVSIRKHSLKKEAPLHSRKYLNLIPVKCWCFAGCGFGGVLTLNLNTS